MVSISRALQLFHFLYSFYLPFMSLRWLPRSVLQIGKNFNMFLIDLTYFCSLFLLILLFFIFNNDLILIFLKYLCNDILFGIVIS